MSGPLTKSVAHGVTWTGVSQILRVGFRLIGTAILARLLLPEDFGVVAMALIITSAMLTLFDMGLNQALIHRRDVTDSHLTTSFWVTLVFGVTTCIIMVAISPLVAKFFKNDLVGPVMAVSSISFIICPLGCIHGTLLSKRLDFFKLSVADTAGAVVYLAVAVIMAWTGFGYWSIVLAGVSNDLTYVILRWVLCRWHPSFTFSFSSLRDLWKFGFNITGTRIVELLNQRLDSLIVGRFLAATVLGFYSLGLRVVSMPSDNLWTIVSTVAFPAFSKIQDQDKRLRLGFLKSIRFVSMIGLPLFTGIAIVGPELVRVAFGQNWSPAILPMQVLCITAIFGMLSISIPSLILSRGRPDINLKISSAKLLLLVPSLIIGVRFGAVGIALGLSTVTVILWPIQLIFASRLIGLKMKEYLAALWPAIFGSVVMAILLLGLRYTAARLFPLPDIGLLASSVVLGVGIYFATLKVTRVQALKEIIELVREMVKPYLRQALMKLGLRRGEAINIAGEK